ncbi:hypothetical protein HK23_10125 [Acetobacter malorum]|uniref:Uncharacterized protein n=1 Tax=Acetobacter malorum TaxID=178901 RepID=A0A1Y3G2Y6_9PROT|nr:hypothetical protein HK23_10125 [Acetobacter malorum]
MAFSFPELVKHSGKVVEKIYSVHGCEASSLFRNGLLIIAIPTGVENIRFLVYPVRSKKYQNDPA